MKPRGAWKSLLGGWVLAGALGMHSVTAHETGNPPTLAPTDIDCGLASLYLLLQLEGDPVALTSLVSELPPRPAAGHSMRDLRDVARRHGVRGTGLLLGPDQPAPRATCLAFVHREGHGHFFVLRPIGHTGKLVQVFDGLGDPVVMDWTNLRKSPGWTGLVLLTDRGGRWLRVAPMIVLAAGLAAALGVPRLRRCRPAVAHA